MSTPSASGDERFGDTKPHKLRNGVGPRSLQFLGGLPHPRYNSEQLQDSTPGDTPSSLSLPGEDEKRDERRAASAGRNRKTVPIRRTKQDTSAASRPKESGNGKELQGINIEPESEDEKGFIVDNYSAKGSGGDNDGGFTIYDAVAGRLGYDGLVKPNQQPVAASDYLFRHQRNPEDDESYEKFSAHRHLKHRLPDSDLLKTIHAHASDFYGTLPDGQDSFESMDETALIAMGILLEEATAEGLGATGDLAFVEAASLDEADSAPSVNRKIKRQKTKHEGDIKFERGVKAESDSSDGKTSLESRGSSSSKKRRREDVATQSESSTEEEDEDEDDAKPTEDGPSHNSDVESWISQTLLDSQGQSNSHYGSSAGLPFR